MSTATGTTRRAPARRAEVLRLPRTTGALSGFLIVLAGIWGGLIPFVGPYFHYAFGGYQSWHFTDQRLWLNIVPGAVAVIGGLMLMRGASRVGGLTAGWVALAAGAWFAIGPAVSILWHHSIYAIGTPAGGNTRQMLEWIGYFYGLGVVIVGLAAFAMGRYFSRPRVAVEAAALAEDAVVADRAHRTAVANEAPVAERTRAPVAADGTRAPVAAEGTRAPVAAEETRAPVAAEETRAPVAADETRAPMAAEETRAPLADRPAADAGAVPAGTAYPGETATTTQPPRRSGGLFGMFRRR
jgi:hypothetical protein